MLPFLLLARILVWKCLKISVTGEKKRGAGHTTTKRQGVGGRRLGAKPDEAVGGEDQREGERFSLSSVRFVTSAHLASCAVACLSNDNQVRQGAIVEEDQRER